MFAKTVITVAGLAVLVATLPFPLPLPAQEVIDLPGRDQRLDADFEEVFRVGVLDGEPWEMFGTVRHVAFDASGNLYVVDGLGMMGADGLRVLVFDASGNFVREFGSAGEGPGEFNMPAGFAVMRDGTTVVRDIRHRAYQLFDANGKYVRMVRGSEGLDELHPDPRGGAVFTGNSGSGITVVSSGDAAATDPPTSRPFLRLDLGGEDVQADTVVDGWLPPRGDEEVELPRNIRVSEAGAALSGLMRGLSRPAVFEPPLLAGVLSDGGIVHSDSSAYALKITPPDAAEVARIILRPLRPEPVTPAIEKEYQESREAARGEGGAETAVGIVNAMSTTRGGANRSGSNQSFSFELPEREFYTEVPVLRSLSTTWEGLIWVQRRGDELESDGPIDVVTADGRYVGTFATGATAMPDAFGPNGMAAFIELDEFDVASVVVRRLPAAVR